MWCVNDECWYWSSTGHWGNIWIFLFTSDRLCTPEIFFQGPKYNGDSAKKFLRSKHFVEFKVIIINEWNDSMYNWISICMLSSIGDFYVIDIILKKFPLRYSLLAQSQINVLVHTSKLGIWVVQISGCDRMISEPSFDPGTCGLLSLVSIILLPTLSCAQSFSNHTNIYSNLSQAHTIDIHQLRHNI